MPGPSWSLFSWLEELINFRSLRHGPALGPVYAAVGILIVCLVLMMAVVGGTKFAARQEPGRISPAEKAGPPVPSANQETAPAAVSQTRDELTNKAAPAAQAAGLPAADKSPRRPVTGEIMLEFGWQPSRVYNDWRYHTGVDLQAPANSRVQSVYGGEILSVYDDADIGLTVAITSGEYTIYYGSLATAKVAKGMKVAAGEQIGIVGSSRGEPYSHLHLAVKRNERYINPLEILNKAR